MSMEFVVDVHGSLMVDVHGVCDFVGVYGGCPWSLMVDVHGVFLFVTR